LLLVAKYARQLRRFDYLHQFDHTLCHPISATYLDEYGGTDHKGVIPRRALCHHRICLLRIIKNNKNTLEYGNWNGDDWKEDEDKNKSLMNDTFIAMNQCHHLKSLHFDGWIPKELYTLLINKLTTSPATNDHNDDHHQHVVALEELKIPLPMLYNKSGSTVADKLRRLLTSPAITSSLCRLLSSPHHKSVISPRTFDNKMAKLTGLTSLNIAFGDSTSYGASNYLAKLVNLQKLEVRHTRHSSN
jgi:hypothetical protein